jgi:hypothetical protein
VATRTDLRAPFGDPAPITAVNSPERDEDAFLSRDGRTLYFMSSRPGGGGGGLDLWFATRAPQ